MQWQFLISASIGPVVLELIRDWIKGLAGISLEIFRPDVSELRNRPPTGLLIGVWPWSGSHRRLQRRLAVAIEVAGVEVLPHLAGQGRPHPWRLSDRLGAGQLDRIDRAEMGQQLLHPFRSQAGDVAEAGALHAFAPLLAMEADRKTVGLIPQPP